MNSIATMQIVPTPEITGPAWDEIWQLTARFYAAERGYVEERLQEHQQLALYRDAADRSLVGVAAIRTDCMEFQGEQVVVIFTNPGHAEGDMLLCLCPLTPENWWGIASRAVGRTLRR